MVFLDQTHIITSQHAKNLSITIQLHKQSLLHILPSSVSAILLIVAVVLPFSILAAVEAYQLKLSSYEQSFSAKYTSIRLAQSTPQINSIVKTFVTTTTRKPSRRIQITNSSLSSQNLLRTSPGAFSTSSVDSFIHHQDHVHSTSQTQENRSQRRSR